jgi:hypothetical protein
MFKNHLSLLIWTRTRSLARRKVAHLPRSLQEQVLVLVWSKRGPAEGPQGRVQMLDGRLGPPGSQGLGSVRYGLAWSARDASTDTKTRSACLMPGPLRWFAGRRSWSLGAGPKNARLLTSRSLRRQRMRRERFSRSVSLS